MAGNPTDENGYTLEEYNRDANGTEFLLGINEWGGWYYNPTYHRISNYKREEVGRNKPMRETHEACRDLPDDIGIGAFVVGEWGGPDADLSATTTFGAAMAFAARLAATGAISRRRAECVSLLDFVDGVQAWRAAKWLGISKSTVRNNATNGRRDIANARALVSFLEASEQTDD